MMPISESRGPDFPYFVMQGEWVATSVCGMYAPRGQQKLIHYLTPMSESGLPSVISPETVYLFPPAKVVLMQSNRGYRALHRAASSSIDVIDCMVP